MQQITATSGLLCISGQKTEACRVFDFLFFKMEKIHVWFMSADNNGRQP